MSEVQFSRTYIRASWLEKQRKPFPHLPVSSVVVIHANALLLTQQHLAAGVSIGLRQYTV